MDGDHQLIVTSCGRELIRRQCADDPALLRVLMRAGSAEPEPDILPKLEARIEAVRQMLHSATPGVIATLCPELLALHQLYEGDMAGRHDRHVLIHSCSWPDQQAVNLIAEWLEGLGMTVETMRIGGLREGEKFLFKEAMAIFTRWCGNVLSNYKIYEFHIIFNPAGGSRILVGLLQTLAPFYAHESVYLLEPGRDLVHMPMPSVQTRGDRMLRQHLHALRRLFAGLSVHPEKLAKIPEQVLMADDEGHYRLSFFGELLWDHNRRDIYGEAMLEPISDRIIITERFRDGAAELDRGRFILLNERLDQLSFLLEAGEVNMDRTTLSLLSLRPLDAPLQESTHSCHGWADKVLWKLLGHYEGSRFVLDALVEG
uniref:CRISPR system ring nuclease SSO1393-like domain-containing protein n=1 Tax=Magnetococcus massalia (strain MO-1) TaxID=451514 RepID=A0A1S7LBX7_MAGMO|nr:Conserved protein of unknown function [Candidatus Magnetococcus massalia]